MIVTLYDGCKTFSSERRAPLTAGLVSIDAGDDVAVVGRVGLSLGRAVALVLRQVDRRNDTQSEEPRTQD